MIPTSVVVTLHEYSESYFTKMLCFLPFPDEFLLLSLWGLAFNLLQFNIQICHIETFAFLGFHRAVHFSVELLHRFGSVDGKGTQIY